MFVIVYGILGDDDSGDLSINGPFFHAHESDFPTAEILARDLANTKTKNQIIPWVFELRDKETIAEAMIRVEDGWYKKFKARTMETYNTIQKDHVNSTCPFVDVVPDNFLTYYLTPQ